MRPILTTVLTAALVAASASADATPRTINDCEAIEAADAYNQCLALFGPVARGHSASAGGDMQGVELAAGKAEAPIAAKEGRRAHRVVSRHNASRHHFARHGHTHGTKVAAHRHGKSSVMLLSVVSERSRLR